MEEGGAKSSGTAGESADPYEFPRVHDLLDENDVDPDFYESTGMRTSQPRRHWCFLGEIMDFTTLHHLEIETKDVDGRNATALLYRGSELVPAQLRSGYTVAILYAEPHAFTFGAPGIRHEDPLMIKYYKIANLQLDLCSLTERDII